MKLADINRLPLRRLARTAVVIRCGNPAPVVVLTLDRDAFAAALREHNRRWR